MKTSQRAPDVRWRLEHGPGSEYVRLSNPGTRAAVDLRVELRRGAGQRAYGALTFDRVELSHAVRLYRFAPDPSLPPWNAITVTWREGGWFARRRLHRWEGVVSPEPLRRRVPRPTAVSSILVPQPRPVGLV